MIENHLQQWPADQRFWRERRVIVTGGSGFLGSFVADGLKARGAAEVIVPCKDEYDLRQLAAIRQLLIDTSLPGTSGLPAADDTDWFPAGHRPVDMVIHLAARVGGIGANRDHPAEFFYENVMMSVPLLHECWAAGVSKFVATATTCAYPKFTPVPFQEDDLWNGYPEETNAPYGLAKKMLLVQSQAYRQQYGYNSSVLFPVNLYGPRDNFNPESSHVMPALIKKCIEARDRGDDHMVAWGDGSPTREFLYVEDAAEGILLAAEHYNSSEPVNLGSSREISIKELTETIAQVVGFTGRIVWDTTQPNGQPRRKVATERARAAFGFEAVTPLLAGLQKTVAWYEAQHMQPSRVPCSALFGHVPRFAETIQTH